MINLILFGPPGSGKGTQAQKLVKKYGFLHISTGDLFRHEIGHQTELGTVAQSYIKKGQLVPDEVTISMLKKKVEKNPGVAGIIFDGFPRTIPQAKALNTLLADMCQSVSALVALDVGEEEIIARILNRARTSGRADDTDVSIIKNRISVYEGETTPVFEFYDFSGKSHHVNGMGTIDEIFDRLCVVIDTLQVEAN